MKRAVLNQLRLPLAGEVIIDNFAGGGGAASGIEAAFGRPVDIAINHDAEAIAMHAANHPHTKHFCESVWDIDPREVTGNQPVGLVWLSPDCKHFSKAKGGKPVEKKIRGLAWVALRWAATTRPRVIMLENVEEFVTWGPLVEGPDGTMRPCPKRKGQTFASFVRALERQGYKVEHRELRACDYGAPTIRKRLFLIARRDGLPIVWPKPTHGDPKSDAVKRGRLLPWRTAAECIDWSIPCPSIFERAKPLVEATQRRIAKGIMRYVVNAAEPFIVPVTHQGDSRSHPLSDPMRTITGAHRGELALAAPYIVPRYGERTGQEPRTHAADVPLPTIVPTANGAQLVAAFLAKHYGGHETPGWPLSKPVSTLTAIDHHGLVTAQLVGCGGRAGQSRPRDASEPMHTITAKADTVLTTSSLVKLRGGGNIGQPNDEPLHTISAGGQWQSPADPMHTIPTKDRIGLVTVAGEDYAIADIGLRMLSPRELFRAQGFRPDYIIGDDPAQGLTLTKSAQVRMVGNSVSPPVSEALIRANFAHELAFMERRA